ncbi:MAG TPA: hypothetical protein VN914_02685 [Polyangia bacterium]|nr:hypothetical protein [Polyangia bacterium]
MRLARLGTVCVLLLLAGCGGDGAVASGVPDHADLGPRDGPAPGDSLPADGPADAAATPDTAATPDDAADASITAGGTILFVVGTSNGSVAAGEGIGDRFVRDRLQKQGYQVGIAADTMGAAALVAMADHADLVLVSESVGSANLQGKLKPVAAPILNYEAFIQDEMGFTPPGPPGDPGLPAQFALGVKMSDTKIDIVDPKHPLAAGFTGTVTVYREPKEITWGKVAATAEVVATLTGDTTGPCIYVYRKGAPLHDGTAAAGLRVGLFLEDDDTTGTPNFLTDEGLKLFDTAVTFTMHGGQ